MGQRGQHNRRPDSRRGKPVPLRRQVRRHVRPRGELVPDGLADYDPSIGRFLFPDEYEGEEDEPTPLNRYLYADADPVNNIDPDGHAPKWLQKGWKSTKKAAKKAYNFAIGDDIRTLTSKKSKWYHKAGAAASIASNFIPGVGAAKWAVKGGVKAYKVGKKAKKTYKLAKGSVKKTRKAKLKKPSRSVNASRSCKCFTMGTTVFTDQGEHPIEQIQIGDKVLARDEATGDTDFKEVEWLYEREVDTTYNIEIGDETISTTDEHPFWVVGEGWVQAKDLRAGDILETNDGEYIAIDRIEVKQEQATVYNFKVKDYHTYFVSGLGIYTHNACKKVPNPNGKKGGSRHQAKVDAIKRDIQKRGLKYDTEYRYKTPNGKKKSRYADVVALDSKGRVMEIYQVGRKTKRHGAPVARERWAIRDIRKSPDYNGARIRYIPYN